MIYHSGRSLSQKQLVA